MLSALFGVRESLAGFVRCAGHRGTLDRGRRMGDLGPEALGRPGVARRRRIRRRRVGRRDAPRGSVLRGHTRPCGLARLSRSFGGRVVGRRVRAGGQRSLVGSLVGRHIGVMRRVRGRAGVVRRRGVVRCGGVVGRSGGGRARVVGSGVPVGGIASPGVPPDSLVPAPSSAGPSDACAVPGSS
ncbi:hypothetical protein [Microbispora sp. GKU 823]|uniref:hypothetical protein n=1 Tax=Microbispora sp. GKU 823 TaxID=1652100 RepID=UPI00117FC4D2|nr:hypothetical protein [Microbispora sp. GKU 823]